MRPSPDISTPILTSVLSGYAMTQAFWPCIARTATYIASMGIMVFLAISCRNPCNKIYSTKFLGLATFLVIFSIKLILFLLDQFPTILALFCSSTKLQPPPSEKRGYSSRSAPSYLRRRDFFRIRRLAISLFFPANHSFLYVIVGSVMAGLTVFLVFPLIRVISYREVIAVHLGNACYAVLAPPEVDPYSTTRGDVYNGVTRCFGLIVLALLWHFSYFLMEFHDCFRFFEYTDYIVRVLIVFAPLFTAFCIGHPGTFIRWIVEWAGRYLFGLGGIKDEIQGLLSMVRSGLVVALVAFCLEFYRKLWLAVFVSFLLVQWTSRSDFWWALLSAAIAAFSRILGSWVSLDMRLVVCSIWLCLVDLALPYMSSMNSYLGLFHFRIFDRVPFLCQIRYFGPSCFVPWMFGELSSSSLFSALVLVCAINKAVRESHVFAVASLVYCGFHLWDFRGSDSTILLFVSLISARKLFSVMPILEFWTQGRSWIYHFQTWTGSPVFLRLFYIVAFQPFGPDRLLCYPALLLSLLTGSPMLSLPSLTHQLLAPSPHRANAFWDDQTLQTYKTLRTGLPNRQIEAPVYVSICFALRKSLSMLLKSGQLGVVDTNDVLFFVCGDISAFVHILAAEPNGVQFQLRGLEYENETICHRSELSRLKNHADTYIWRFFWMRTFYETTCWRLRNVAMPIRSYSFTSFDVNTAFCAIAHDHIRLYCALSFALVSSRNLEVFESVEGGLGSHEEPFVDFWLFAECSPAVNFVWGAFSSAVFCQQGRCQTVNYALLYQMFDGIVPQHFKQGPTSWLFGNTRLVNEIVFPAVRQTVLVLILAALSVFPEIEDRGELKDAIEDLQHQYLALPLASPEFIEAVQEEKMGLVTMVKHQNQISVVVFRMGEFKWKVFSIQREVIRSFWATETESQIFLGERRAERQSIQSNPFYLHNLILQSANLPVGYPAFVSQITPSYCFLGNSWPIHAPL
jgi:hypothetical protein